MWETTDECLGASSSVHDNLVFGKNYLKTLDAVHPVWSNQTGYENLWGSGWRIGGFRSWKDIADTASQPGVFSEDYYPITNQTFPNVLLGNPARNLDFLWQIADADGTSPYNPTSPIFMVFQGQAIGECSYSTTYRRPSFQETRAMAYTSIIHGARGVIWWGTYDIEPNSDLWKSIKRVASELRYLQDVLTCDDAAVKLQRAVDLTTYSPDPYPYSVLNNISSGNVTLGDYRMECMEKVDSAGNRYLIVANNSSADLGSKTIDAPGFNAARNGNRVRVLFECTSTGERRISTASSSWSDTFGPWAVHVYTDKIFTQTENDFDSDGKSDCAVYMSEDGSFEVKTSSSGFTKYLYFPTQYPAGTPISGDYDGDGKADICVYIQQDGNFHILTSSSNYQTWLNYSVSPNSTPISGDFDGNGLSDPAVYQQDTSTIKVLASASNYAAITWNVEQKNMLPVCGDYDGDGKTDPCLFLQDTGLMSARLSASNYAAETWNLLYSRTTPIAGDYDGDGKIDPGIFLQSDGWLDIQASTEIYNWWSYDIPYLNTTTE